MLRAMDIVWSTGGYGLAKGIRSGIHTPEFSQSWSYPHETFFLTLFLRGTFCILRDTETPVLTVR